MELKVQRKDAKSILSKTEIPLGNYAANPYTGCPHACRYCYASFMKRFTGHGEDWGTFADVKYWPRIPDPSRYSGETVTIGTVTDPYNPLEEEYRRTRALLEQLSGSGARVVVCTRSDLVLRDLDLLTRMDATVSISVNTLDESFRADMDRAVSIDRRLEAMRRLHEAGVRTVCFVSPIFPGITDPVAIVERTRDFCDFVWLENLNLRGGFKKDILDYVSERRPDLVPLYDSIYVRGDMTYWHDLDRGMASYAGENGMAYVDNRLPDGRSPRGHPTLINYLFHEQVRGSVNTGRRTLRSG